MKYAEWCIKNKWKVKEKMKEYDKECVRGGYNAL